MLDFVWTGKPSSPNMKIKTTLLKVNTFLVSPQHAFYYVLAMLLLGLCKSCPP